MWTVTVDSNVPIQTAGTRSNMGGGNDGLSNRPQHHPNRPRSPVRGRPPVSAKGSSVLSRSRSQSPASRKSASAATSISNRNQTYWEHDHEWTKALENAVDDIVSKVQYLLVFLFVNFPGGRQLDTYDSCNESDFTFAPTLHQVASY